MSSGGNGIQSAPLYGTPEQQFADPFQIFGRPQPPPALPSTLPNLGSASLTPQAPRGAFVAPGLGGGKFNAMAQALAGPLFDPAAGGAAPQGTGALPSVRQSLPQLLAALNAQQQGRK